MRIQFQFALLIGACAACGFAAGDATVAGRVVDETGAAVAGARVEFRGEGKTVAASSDPAGDFKLAVAAGVYEVRAERLGFYAFHNPALAFAEGANHLTITLNHEQEFPERIDVSASPAAVDPQQTAGRKELDNTEVQAVPYAAPADYRSALPLFDGVVQDNTGRPHFNGGASSQTTYVLDGFNVANPVTGLLDARVNIDSIQSLDLQSTRFSAGNGRGSAGVLELKTKMGDDRWRFGGTNFIPGVATDGGWHINKWTPRLEFSGPIVKGRAWFHNGADLFYSNDVIHDLPTRPNRTHGTTFSDLTRFQVNVTPGNIITAGVLLNVADATRSGLSFLTPAEATTNSRQILVMNSVRDQQYFQGGALLEAGFADTRGLLRSEPQGSDIYEITPFGNRGNYFENLDRHFYRQQGVAGVYLPLAHWHGTHLVKIGTDLEREAFHQTTLRHDYEVLDAENEVARYVTFAGSPFQKRKNFEAANYIQDHWTVRDGLNLEFGLRAEWNEIVRIVEMAPRVAAAWAPRLLRGTKLSAGWGIYYDAISLELFTRQQGQTSYATFYLPDNIVQGPVPTTFQIDERSLKAPYYRNASFQIERKLPFDLYLSAGYVRRSGQNGFAFNPVLPAAGIADAQGSVYALRNNRTDHYDAVEASLHRTFAGKYEWFAGYTRSAAKTSAGVDYSLENPVFGPQAPGRVTWDAPDRFHMWGWAPLPTAPHRLQWITRNTTWSYLLEYRTGFPFSVVSQQGVLAGAPNALRLPDYFNLNLQVERQFRAIHYLWAWRGGFDNITNSRNPNYVNNVAGTPDFLTYGRGQSRAFSVRLRFLGRK
ncbi:MAG TPA: TonB-dependent receptor [Candidatus Limnocylindrales bacterium]|nr:TonB-dependent receptor [Candidatus Limnocylindrales bacterium]